MTPKRQPSFEEEVELLLSEWKASRWEDETALDKSIESDAFPNK